MNRLLYHKSPKELEQIIKRSVIGQDAGVRIIATALSAHITRIIRNKYSRNRGPVIHKDNLLILGPTGCGKTESIRTVIRELQLPIPIAVISANGLSSSGYKGRNLDTVLEDLYRDAKRIFLNNPGAYVDKNEIKDNKITTAQMDKSVLELTNTGIIVFDEFDKIACRGENVNADSYKRLLQSEMLKLVEGGKGFGEKEIIQGIDTTEILFIFSGAFTDLLSPPAEQIPIGFHQLSPQQKEVDNSHIPTTQELVKYGFMQELIGRIPLKCCYRALSVGALYKILAKSNISPVQDFQALFQETGNSLKIENSALKAIARQAFEIGTGARGLRTIMGEFLYPLLYKVDGVIEGKEITITKAVVNNGDKPKIDPRREPIEDINIETKNIDFMQFL